MRDIRLVFQPFLCMSNAQPKNHQARSPSRSLMPAQSNQTNWPWQNWWNISEGENTGLGNWINTINHRQESAINGICFPLGADHRRQPCAGMGMRIILPVLWPHLSSAWPETKVHSRVYRRVHRCHPTRNKAKQNTASYLSVKVAVDVNIQLQVQQKNWGHQ